MKVRFRYNQCPSSPSLESLAHQLIGESLVTGCSDAVERALRLRINLSFEAGEHGYRVRMRYDDGDTVLRLCGVGGSLQGALIEVVAKAKNALADELTECLSGQAPARGEQDSMYGNWSEDYLDKDIVSEDGSYLRSSG